MYEKEKSMKTTIDTKTINSQVDISIVMIFLAIYTGTGAIVSIDISLKIVIGKGINDLRRDMFIFIWYNRYN